MYWIISSIQKWLTEVKRIFIIFLFGLNLERQRQSAEWQRQMKAFYFVEFACKFLRHRQPFRSSAPQFQLEAEQKRNILRNSVRTWLKLTTPCNQLVNRAPTKSCTARVFEPCNVWNLLESMTVGSRSTMMARGTWRPEPVGEKNVENESSEVETESAYSRLYYEPNERSFV